MPAEPSVPMDEGAHEQANVLAESTDPAVPNPGDPAHTRSSSWSVSAAAGSDGMTT